MPKSLLLFGISGSRVGQQTTISIRSSIVGSRSDCDVVLPDRQVLPRHAEIRQSLDRWFILPLEPGALIFINGTPIRSQQRVDEGDLVTIGTATFKAMIAEVNEVGGRR